ncbi:ClpXP protease specificity-enhancing factor SspB [Acetobacteraceae bacterium ESL0709]|nr:ClpXP protease specificity-enhancing factor SspB [Acetobacteraceae bacterium ESL0697]MDF7678481.1 ClpXP protease specificity-enhancing factor SspB [Acetobacteraceae bacterium ESL0709]
MSDDFNGNGPDDFDSILPASLIPYDAWLQDAHRDVMLKALDYASKNGLPGEHHFYLTFLTTVTGVEIPQRLKERYPQEMTIVLQHQFRDLVVDHQKKLVSVGLSFGGIPTTLVIPVNAIIAFADPHIQFGLRFTGPTFSDDLPAEEESLPHDATISTLYDLVLPSGNEEKKSASPAENRQQAEVVSLDAFRKRSPETDSPSPRDNA